MLPFGRGIGARSAPPTASLLESRHPAAAYKAGDSSVARAHAEKAAALVQILDDFGGLAVGKAIMRIIGVDCGPVRLPLRSLSREEVREVEGRLVEAGISELLSTLR